MKQNGAGHWLVNAVQRGGLDVPDGTSIDPGSPLVSAWQELAERCGVGAGRVAEVLAHAFRLEVADLGGRDRAASRILTEELCRRFLVIPIGQTDKTLFVATANPSDFDAESEIRFISGRDTQFRVAPPQTIVDAIRETWAADHRDEVLLTNKALEDATRAVRIAGQIEREREGDPTGFPAGSPAEKLTNLILYEGVRAGAEAILIEPQQNGGRVRIKTANGVTTLLTLPRAAMGKTLERIRSLAGYGRGSSRESRGRFDAVISDVPYRLRVARTVEEGRERVMIQLSEATRGDHAGGDIGVEAAEDPRPLVLVVDDDPSDRLLLRTVLEGSGFRVMEATDGPPALKILEDPGDIALVILDLMMPEMHGLEVLKAVRSSIRTVGLPVVVMTGSDNPDDELALFEAGADDYLHKPVHPPRMIVRIRAVLRRAGVRIEH